MIKGRMRMFDERLGEAIGSFLDYSQSASLSYKGDNTLFNTFASPDKYRKDLKQMYDWAKDEIEIAVADTRQKYNKSLVINDVLTEAVAALALLSKSENGKFTHKNFPGIESEGKTVNEADFHDFYYWSDHYLRKMVKYLKGVMKSVGRIENEVFENTTSEKTKPIENSFNLKVAPKKGKATSLFKALVELGCMAQSSESDFVNVFTGNPITAKINWIGKFGDLKTFINSANDKGLIDKSGRHLVIASNVFTTKGVKFNSTAIKDTKHTTNDAIIRRIVNSTI